MGFYLGWQFLLSPMGIAPVGNALGIRLDFDSVLIELRSLPELP